MPRVMVASATRCTASPYAATRIGSLRVCAVSHVSSNARLTMSLSFAFTSTSFQKYSWRPCTHSKYETTTPPAFASTSGRMRMPRSSRIASAAGVTGPFAPSQMLEGARREDVALEQHELLVCDRLGVLEPGERPVLRLVRERGGNVDPLRVVQ